MLYIRIIKYNQSNVIYITITNILYANLILFICLELI